MARVLLVNPPFYRLLGSHYNGSPLGLGYIAAVLNAAGHDAWVYNADFVDTDKYKDFQSLLAGFPDYLAHFDSPDSPVWRQVVEKILSFQPDWVGYTLYTAGMKAVDIISQAVQSRLPKVRQVVGGVHASLDPSVLSQLSSIQFSIVGDGEFAMLQLVEHDGSGSLSWDAIDVNTLPFPERDKMWEVCTGSDHAVDVLHAISGRGCPYRCTYCASSALCDGRVRYRTPDSVVKELKLIEQKYWRSAVRSDDDSRSDLHIVDNSIAYFVDDVFTLPKRRVISILQAMIDHDFRVPWKCEARADHLDAEICNLMADAGCVRVKVGFESGCNRILKEVRKGETTEDMLRGAAFLHEARLPFTAYFLAGFPGETDSDLCETIAFARELQADCYSLSILAPYYGTVMYQDLLAQGYPLDKLPWEYFYHQVRDPIVNHELSSEVIDEFLSLGRGGYV